MPEKDSEKDRIHISERVYAHSKIAAKRRFFSLFRIKCIHIYKLLSALAAVLLFLSPLTAFNAAASVENDDGGNMGRFIISTSDNRPLAMDRLLYAALLEAGIRVEFSVESAAQGFALADSGERAAVTSIIPNMEEVYTNLLKVPATIETTTIDAVARAGTGLTIKDWSDLSGLTVGVLQERVYILEAIPEAIAGIVPKDSNEHLFEGLVNNEYDIVLLAKRTRETITLPEYVERAGRIDTLPEYLFVHKNYEDYIPAITESLRGFMRDGRGENILNDIPMPGLFPKKTILHIVSSSSDITREAQFASQLRESFENKDAYEWYTFELDSKRFSIEGNRLSFFASILRQDCVSRDISAIIVSGDAAFNFLQKYYNQLFRNVPVLFSGVYESAFEEEYSRYFTGIFEHISPLETVDAAVSLFPGTQTIYVLNDYTDEGSLYRKITKNDLLPLEGKYNIEYSPNVSIDEILLELRMLPENSIVLVGSFFRDINGQYISQDELKRLFGLYCSAPVFTTYSSDLPYNALGGYVPDYNLYGETIANMLSDVLGGARISSIPTLSEPARFCRWVFDSNRLAEFKIGSGRLPANSVVINKAPSILVTNPNFAFSMLMLISMSIIVILGLTLFLNKFRRQNLELTEARKHLHTAEEMLAKDAKIKEVKERLEGIINTAPVLFMLLKGNIVIDMNERMKSMDIVNIGDETTHLYKDPERYRYIASHLIKHGVVTNEVVVFKSKSFEGRRFLINLAMVDYEQDKAVAVWAIDIEDGELKRDQLNAARTSLQTMLDTMPVAVVIADDESYDLVYCNKSGMKMLGLSLPQEVHRLALFDMFPQFQLDGMSASTLAERLMSAHEPDAMGIQIQSRAGKLQDVRIRVSPIDYEGRKSKICIMTDLSREKQLLTMQDSLQSILDTLPIPVRITDMATKTIVYSNNSCCSLYGYGPGKLYGRLVLDTMPEYQSNGALSEDIVNAVHSEYGLSSAEVEYMDADGRIFEAELLNCSIEYMGRKSTLGIIRDLAVEKEYKRMQLYLQTVLDFLPIPVTIFNIETKKMAYMNKSALELFGCERLEDTRDLKVTDLISPSNELSPSELDEILGDDRTLLMASADVTCLKSTGEEFEAHVTDCEIDYKGTPSILGVIRDLTAEKEYERMLVNAAENEKEANQMKSRFLVNMSHEIRTPMNAVIGLTEIELRKKPPKEAREVYKKINTSAKDLLQIINDILDLSKIESEKMELYEYEFEVEELLNSAMLVATPRLDGKNVEMILKASLDLPRYLIGDRTRLWQILKNFLDNSAKFTDKGRIVLMVSVVEGQSDEEVVTLSFTVQDTGIGMNEQQLEAVFQPYEQFYSDAQKRYSGTGLGMPISQQLCELMGGSMEISSKPGEGTKIEAIIPFRRAANRETEMEHIKYPELKGLNILVVDDDNTSLEIMSGLLKCNDVNFVLARNGREAMQTVFEYRDMNKNFDAILLDYMMEGLSGLETARQIHIGLSKSPKLLMVTAYQKQLLKRELDANGIDDILEKPFIPTQFIQKLCATLGIERESEEEEKEESFTVFNDSNVLLVEDNRLNQEVAAGMLKYFGISPVIAENGMRAIEILNEVGTFDLILMDLKMPVMDGYEATRAIREDGRFNDIPIISLTADAMVEVIGKCIEAGMNDHLTKPIEIEKLHATLVKWLPESRRNQKAELRIKRLPHPSDEASRAHNEALLRFQGDEKLYKKALLEFALELPEEWRSFESAMEDKEETLKYVHSLKGVSGNLSEMDIYNKTMQFEGAVKKSSPSAKEQYKLLAESALEAKKRLISELKPAEAAVAAEEGGSVEFYEILDMLKEALVNYDPGACSELAEKLKQKNWPFADDIKIKKMLEYAEAYEFDEATDILEGLRSQ